MILAEHKRVQLKEVLGKKGIAGHEMTNSLANQKSEIPIIGAESACGIFNGAVRWAVWE
jgi:hypothetical protein